MPTTEIEDTIVTKRKTVILTDAERRNLRRKLKGSVNVAQDVLNPRNQLKRLVDRKQSQVRKLASDTGEVARKNAPLLSAIGIGALLFAARRPISGWIAKLRHGTEQEIEQDLTNEQNQRRHQEQ